jgi:hypothetical protein
MDILMAPDEFQRRVYLFTRPIMYGLLAGCIVAQVVLIAREGLGG